MMGAVGEYATWWYFLVLGLPLILFFVARTIYLLHSIRKTRQMKDPRIALSGLSPSASLANTTTAKQPLKTLIVLGSGGHTTEMLDLIKNLNQDRYGPIVLVVADTDTTSIQRVQAYPHHLPIRNKDNLIENSRLNTNRSSNNNEQQVYRIPRSREVGQSYASSIFTTLYSFLFAFWLVGYQVRRRRQKMTPWRWCSVDRHITAQHVMPFATA
jgi:hypothetical protein